MTAIRKSRLDRCCTLCGGSIKAGHFYGQNGRTRECWRCMEIDPKTGKES